MLLIFLCFSEECGTESVIKEGAVVQCSDNSCGNRIMYKKRTHQSKFHFRFGYKVC